LRLAAVSLISIYQQKARTEMKEAKGQLKEE
jgi:hypothetical protein